MDVGAYLQRIDVQKEEPSFEYLAILQNNHMERIPFENLDVTRKVPITLDVQRFFAKVMGNQRGGFCYELNGLFQQLLAKLGFQSYLISCTVKKPTGWAKENTHAASIVELDEKYLVDVGFGDSVRQPLPLSGEERTDVSGTYRVLKLDNGQYDLQRLDNKEWKILYRFTDEVRELADFTEGCHYNQTSPDSTFTHGDIVTIATETGRITLSGNTVTETRNGTKHKHELTEAEKAEWLKKYFHITL